jgi:PAS domain S-box-containing protein
MPLPGTLIGDTDLLHLAFYSARPGMAIVSLRGEFMRVNPSLCQIVGYPEEEIQKLTFQEITHPDDLEPDLEQVGRLVRGEISGYEMEKRYFRKDGSIVWVQLSVAAVRDNSGLPICFPVNILDLTNRKEKEAKPSPLQRKMSQATLAKLLHDSTFGDEPESWLTEREQKVLTLVAKGKTSKEIASLLGISPRTVEVHRATGARKIKLGSLVDLVCETL